MSEVKRAKLISFGSQRVNNKNQKEVVKTARIAVNLPESTEDKCPEFNYKDLFATAKRRHAAAIQKNSVPKPQQNGLDPFEDDEDVKRIAAEMEAKYGIGVAKKRKWRKDDYADIGMGYDESDSFIDNTDGYDEIIPKNVTTLHGGFYINCGALEFKTDECATSDESSSSDEEDTPEKPNNTRKRVLESSAESEEETQVEKVEKVEDKEKLEHQDKKQKVVVNTNGMQNAIKKRLFSHDKIKQQMQKNGRPEETKKTVRELLRERREDLNMTITTETEIPDKPVESASPPKEIKKPLASIDDVIESVISGAIKKKDEHTDESSKDSIISKDGVNSKSVINSSEADSNDGVQMKPVDIVQLPENLPSDIIEIIESIKKAAACSTEGKVKFFSGHVNTMLLDLERKCRCLGKQSRMKVYEHLAPFVKCRKETLIKRAKNLCAVEELKKIKVLQDRLKAAVGVIMPSVIENYEAECKAILQKKFSLQSDETTKNMRMPKRLFTWNDEIKKLVKDIITLRKKCYINEGKQRENIEKHLTEFIKTDLQVIWPDGWMTMNTLMKFCNIVQDTKKNLDVPKKNPPPSTLDISISPTSNISPPNLPISSTSSLTITPVTTNVHKVSTIEAKVKPKPLNLNETIISKVNSSSDSCSISKSSKPLPAVDIIKTTTAPDVNNVIHTVSTNNVIPPVLIKDESETIIIEESPVKKEEPENLSSSHMNVIKHEQLENSTDHCQIIDLTEQPEFRRKPGPKSKSKYVYEFPEKPMQPKKESLEQIRVKQKEELTGASAITQSINEKQALKPKKDNLELIRVKQKEELPGSSVFTQIIPEKQPVKPKKDALEVIRVKQKEELTGSSVFTQIIPEKQPVKPKKDALEVIRVKQKEELTGATIFPQIINEKQPVKPKKDASELIRVKQKEELTGSSVFTQMINEKQPVKPKKDASEHIRVKQKEELTGSSVFSRMINEKQPVKPKKDASEHIRVKQKEELTGSSVFPQTINEKQPVKPKKDASEHIRVKHKEELTGSSALTQLIADSLSDVNRFAQISSNSSTINSTASISNINDTIVKKSSFDFPKGKPTSERDDIQKVMEGLMVLQKMSSPVKSNDEVKTSSPVSVIAFNKSYSHDSNSSSHAGNIVSHRSSSFQDAFQKQFIPDYHLMKANQTASSPPKGNHNSISKHNHSITKSSSTGSERYLQNSNNNYAQQNSNKLKTSCSSQQSGSYNMLDDMFANFLSEYGHSKTANSKSSSQHK